MARLRCVKYLFTTISIFVGLIAVGLGYLKFDDNYRQRIFAKFLNKVADPNDVNMMNLRCNDVLRAENIHGDVLEIGAGTGINFPCLYQNERIRSYIGIEPNVHMFDYFHNFTQQYPISFEIRLLNESATDMKSVASNSIDTVIMTLVLCSIPDPMPSQVLREVHRILKPGGTFLFFEHIEANPEKNPLIYTFQRAIEPAWAIMGDGCRFKPIKNYFDDVRNLFGEVIYEEIPMPVPFFFIKDGLKGKLVK